MTEITGTIPPKYPVQEIENQDEVMKHEVMIALADYVDWLYKEKERLAKIWDA